MNNNIINKLKTYLKNNDTIVFGYLFGSYANNVQTNNSDIDIALYLNNISLDNKLQINYEISKLLKKDIDLLVLNNIKNIYLLDNILNNSVIVKDNELRFDFEIIKQHDILDFKEFRKFIDVA